VSGELAGIGGETIAWCLAERGQAVFYKPRYSDRFLGFIEQDDTHAPRESQSNLLKNGLKIREFSISSAKRKPPISLLSARQDLWNTKTEYKNGIQKPK
jgi:hypothetical protein